MGPTLPNLAGICLFRNGPQDLPYAPQALAGAVALSAALTFIAGSNLPESGNVAAQVAVATLFAAAFLYALLALRGLQARFVQSATAIFGTDAVIGFPVVLLSFPIGAQGPEQAPGAAAGILLLWGWHLVILGHIFRHTLELKLPLGLLLALAYSFLGFQAVQLVA